MVGQWSTNSTMAALLLSTNFTRIMTGIYRLLLASYVVIFHLSNVFPFAGQVSVFAFYTISGYLITLVVNGTYKGRIGLFFLNRAVRIYPTYWLCLAFSALVVVSVGPEIVKLHKGLVLPQGGDLWSNLFIFGLKGTTIRLLPPAWSLNTELVYYLLMGLLLSHSRIIAATWFCISVLLAMAVLGKPWEAAYFNFLFPSLAFATGTCLFYAKDLLAPASTYASWVVFVLCSLFPLAPMLFEKCADIPLLKVVGSTHFLYMSPFVACAAVIACNNLKIRSRFWKKFDKIAGDMSYPTFLIHWPVAGLLAHHVFGTWQKTPQLAFASLLGTWLVSLLIATTFEHQIAKIRDKLRPHRRLEALPTSNSPAA